MISRLSCCRVLPCALCTNSATTSRSWSTVWISNVTCPSREKTIHQLVWHKETFEDVTMDFFRSKTINSPVDWEDNQHVNWWMENHWWTFIKSQTGEFITASLITNFLSRLFKMTALTWCTVCPNFPCFMNKNPLKRATITDIVD